MKDSVENYYKPLLGYINKRVNNKFDAEDILHDVFLKLSQSNLDDILNLKNWLYAITRNAIIDYYRKKKLEIRKLEENFSDEVHEESTVHELSQCINPFIEALPGEYADLLKLYEIEGVSQKEIAVRLDMNYATVRSKVQRGRTKLMELFTECCEIVKGGRGSIICFNHESDCC